MISPFDSITEITAELTIWKAALTACAAGKEYQMTSGGNSRVFKPQDLPEIRTHLNWLAGERAKFQKTGRPITVIGRAAR